MSVSLSLVLRAAPAQEFERKLNSYRSMTFISFESFTIFYSRRMIDSRFVIYRNNISVHWVVSNFSNRHVIVHIFRELFILHGSNYQLRYDNMKSHRLKDIKKPRRIWSP